MPHTCPVCQGATTVSAQLYEPFTNSTAMPGRVPCRSCGATGVVWEQTLVPWTYVSELPYVITNEPPQPMRFVVGNDLRYTTCGAISFGGGVESL